MTQTYYERLVSELNRITSLEEKKNFVKHIDYSKQIEKDSDAKLIKELRLFEEWPLKEVEKKAPTPEEFKEILIDIYEKIIEALKEYIDLKEEYYSLVAIWIIGTYFHNSFSSYPYLFINAMRGSGKSRLLQIISVLSKEGIVLSSPTEAVLFRMPKGQTLCIDEFEGVMRKGNESLREILNASYKKGGKVRRMKQKKSHEGTTQEIEEFEPYKPICLANIYGMEEVLSDRCITLILEKSSRKDIMRLLEDFEDKITFKLIKHTLNEVLVYQCSYFSVSEGIERWNNYIKSRYTYTNTLTTQTTQTTQTTLNKVEEKYLEMFNKIDETGINGRNLELFFPLMYLSRFISENAFETLLNIASDLNKEKRREEMVESKDVSLYDFVSKLQTGIEFKTIRDLTIMFRNFVGDVEENEDRWINEKWIGRALRRLGLIIDKRRVARGIEVTLNIEKAKEKIKAFQ